MSNEVFLIHPYIFLSFFFENGATTHSAETPWAVPITKNH